MAELTSRSASSSGVASPRLDDPREAAVRVADDAPVAARVVGLEREHGGGGAGGCVRLEQRAQGLGRSARGVAGEHEHVAGEALERVARRADGVAGAARLLLDGDLEPVESPRVVRARRRRRPASTPASCAAPITQSTIRRPSSGCRCFGVALFMRVPRPAAMTTAARSSVMSGE